MPKFEGVVPLGALNVIKFRHIFTGVNALLLIHGHLDDPGTVPFEKRDCPWFLVKECANVH